MGEAKHICVDEKDPVELGKLMMQEREGMIMGHRQEGLESRGQVQGWTLMEATTPHVLGKRTENEGKIQVSWWI